LSRQVPVLYRNEGDGNFIDVTFKTGLAGLSKVRNLSLGDYDNDGDLDIYVVRRNDGDDAYTTELNDLRYKLRVSNNIEKGFEFTGPSPMEFDTYRFGARENPNHIFIGSNGMNPDAVPFTLDSSSSLTHGLPPYSPGIDSGTFIWYDPLDDKWNIRHSIGELRAGFGIIVSSPETIVNVVPLGLEIDSTSVPNQLFQNQGDGTFIDVTDQAGVGDLHQGQASVWADFDNDGDVDLYVVNSGRILNESNILYENLGDGTFVNVASESGTVALTEGRGESVAVADYDNDGFIDFLVLNGFGIAPFSYGSRVLFHNGRSENHWLQIKLVGNTSNRDGVGSTVTLEAGFLRLTRQQTGGMHCFSQNSQVLQFGLGDETMVDKITVRWPSGIVQQLSNIDVNQRLVVEEPSVSLTLSADTLTVPQGGVLGVQVRATNYTNEDQSFLFASNVTLPNGSIKPSPPELLFGPQWVTLAPYETKHRHITHDIPIDAPLGTYIYNGYVGKGLQDIWNECHFDFTVTP